MNNIKLMPPMLSHLQSNSLIQLSRILNAWLDNQGLPHESADEVVHTPDLTDDQEAWLKSFIDAWNGLEDVGRFSHHLEKEVDPDFIYAMKNFQNNEALQEGEGRCPECHSVLTMGSAHAKEFCNYMAHRNEALEKEFAECDACGEQMETGFIDDCGTCFECLEKEEK